MLIAAFRLSELGTTECYGSLNVKLKKKSINSERPGFQCIPQNAQRKKGGQIYLTHKN